MIRVLLADDSPHAQRMGKEILAGEGFEVLGVTDGQQAIESLGAFSPQLVMADVCMPGPNGYSICERIKTDPALGHVKVVLLRGAQDPFDAEEARRVGADQVLVKPLEPSQVLDTLRALVAPDGVTRAPRGAPPAAGESPSRTVRPILGPRAEPRDPERVRAAVVLAVESALPAFLDELTERVLEALRNSNSHAR